MDIKILYDNTKSARGFKTGWGFSVLINDTILFDTGEDPGSLRANMEKMNVDPAGIQAVVLSHEHWDHIDGIWGLFAKRPGLTVYGCPHFSQECKDNIGMHGGRYDAYPTLHEIAPHIFVSGEMKTEYKGKPLYEQSLIIRTDTVCTLITGCAHPGILTIIDKVRNDLTIDTLDLVLGGFHLKDKKDDEIEGIIAEFRARGVRKIAPAHCTGERAITLIKKAFGPAYIPVGAGATITI
ncbi:MAG: MBL fold metallo-hydrolase [Candidatus Omnitrophica bacterium]|nr:MBL fold metallo-hydrolase [Candidatus Omnitrophota bacterium]